MESKNELKKTDIKNHACYYFDNIMRVIDINSRDNLLDEKKTFVGSVSLRVSFHEIDLFIKIYDGIRYLVLFGDSFDNEIFDRITYFISTKNSITGNLNHNFQRIRIGS